MAPIEPATWVYMHLPAKSEHLYESITWEAAWDLWWSLEEPRSVKILSHLFSVTALISYRQFIVTNWRINSISISTREQESYVWLWSIDYLVVITLPIMHSTFYFLKNRFWIANRCFSVPCSESVTSIGPKTDISPPQVFFYKVEGLNEPGSASLVTTTCLIQDSSQTSQKFLRQVCCTFLISDCIKTGTVLL